MLMYLHPAIDNELAFLYPPEGGSINDLSPSWKPAGRFFRMALEHMKGNAEFLIEVLGASKPDYWHDENGRLSSDRRRVKVDPRSILDNTIDLVKKNARRKEGVDSDLAELILNERRDQVKEILGEAFIADRWSQVDSMESGEVDAPGSKEVQEIIRKARKAVENRSIKKAEKKAIKKAENKELRATLRRSSDSQRKAKLLREIGPLATNPGLAMDYVVVLGGYWVDAYELYDWDNLVFERFEKELREEYNNRKSKEPGLPSRTRIVPKAAISDRRVWNTLLENPKTPPLDLLRKMLEGHPDAESSLRFILGESQTHGLE